jgi:thioredoxin-related protein
MVKAFMVAALLLAGVSVASAAEIGGDGLHKEDWFSLSFRDIREDMDAARAEGKGLVLVFEQRGCIYCAKMHEEILSDGEVRDFIRSNFKVVQYNLFGSEEVTDLDGKALVEKTAARRWNAGRRDGGASGRRHHAGRLREADLPAHVPVGA